MAIVSGSSITSYDYFDLPEIPTFILCNPSGEQLYALGGISERTYKARYTTFSELSFRADKYVDETLMPYFDSIVYRRLVFIDGLGYFMITKVTEDGDGITLYKNVECQSVEVEMSTKKISQLYELEPYKFYDETTPETTLMGIIIDQYIPNWTFEIVDESATLIDRYRSFDVSDTTVYTFLTTEVATAYDCYFVFDNTNKIVYAHDASNTSPSTDIFISYDNVINSIKIEEVTDNLVTVMTVLGGNDLDIRPINVLASNRIYNFDYFKTTDWMSQDLVTAIDTWETGVSASQIAFETQFDNLNALLALDTQYQVDLTVLNQEYAVLEIELAAAIEAGDDTSTIQSDMEDKQDEIDDKKLQISSNDFVMDSIESAMASISDAVSITDNFTTEQYKNLQMFMLESTYINENFEARDSMSASSLKEESRLLYEQGQKSLLRVYQPRFTFDIDAVNILMIKEFSTFKDQLALGVTITIEVKEGVYITPILLGFDLDFDNPTNFTMTFGNRFHLDDDSFQFSDLITASLRSATTSQLNSSKWNTNSASITAINTFINSPIEAADNNITSASLVFSGAGLTGTGTGGQKVLMNNVISFIKTTAGSPIVAIGNTDLDTTTNIPTEAQGIISGDAFGLVANGMVGYLIADDELIITNSSGTVVVTASGINIEMEVNSGLNTIIINETSGITIKKGVDAIFYLDSSGDLIIT